MIIAVATQKGGSAKTTTVVNLSAALAERGKRVLIVDLDPQGHASYWLLGNAGRQWGTFVHQWLRSDEVLEPQRPSGWANLDIISANMELSDVRDELSPRERPSDGRLLLERLEPLRSRYDWIFLDCPASFDSLTINALLAADGLIVPIGPPEPLALDGLQHMVSTLARLHEDQNPRLRLLGVLVSNVQLERATHRHTVERMESTRLPLFSTMISSTARIGAAAEHHQPVVAYAPKSFVADAYRVLSLEVEKRSRGWLWNWVAGTAGA